MSEPIQLYRTSKGIVMETENGFGFLAAENWDELINRESLHAWLREAPAAAGEAAARAVTGSLLAPIGTQEVWACGVTYYSSRLARMEEAHDAGGGDFYARVYTADRPEIFFKATPARVVGPGGALRIRRDSTWDVPEPELTLVINRRAEIIGYTVGNDMSSRSIEGENPLYLPQAKTFERCAGIGPGIRVCPEPLPPETRISMEIHREGEVAFSGETRLSEMKRDPSELVGYLLRELEFPRGVYLMTGTGIIPDTAFTLEPGDTVAITIEGIGRLENMVERRA